MLANYGYKDGSGDFFITVDTELCDGCGDCLPACPAGVLELRDNDFDLDSETKIAAVADDQSKKLKYACGPCKPAHGFSPEELPCVRACGAKKAIAHSW